jgi:hypothetical protein
MQSCAESTSFSAPKILQTCNSPIFKVNLSNISPKVSPGESPSCFAITNIALDAKRVPSSRDFFFNPDLSLTDLHRLNDVNPILEEDDDDQSCLKNLGFISKSALQKPSKSPATTQVPDENKKEEQKTKPKHEPRFVPITVKHILLKMPPMKPGIAKRNMRGTFNEQEISYDRYCGFLKFYNLKKRYGFMLVENEDFEVFICEDDLLVSGQNLRKFKDDVYKKKSVQCEFNVKKYLNDEGVEKRKAINIMVKET